MIIQFHTPKGIVNIDSETVTDEQLAELNITRADLDEALGYTATYTRQDEARLQEILANSPEVITMPEIWEAIRLLAKQRGI